jgi:hypothetical protein
MVLQLDIQRWLNQPLHAAVSPSKFHRNQSPGNLGKTYTANRHLRSEETPGVAYEKPLNPFTSHKRMPGTKHVARQLCKTSDRPRLTNHIDLHTPATPPTANKQKLQNSIFDVIHQNQPISCWSFFLSHCVPRPYKLWYRSETTNRVMDMPRTMLGPASHSTHFQSSLSKHTHTQKAWLSQAI